MNKLFKEIAINLNKNNNFDAEIIKIYMINSARTLRTQRSLRLVSRCSLNAFLILIIMMSSAFAQFPKGTKSINGSINWSKMSYDGKDLGSLLVLTPSAGYFLFKNFEFNINLNFSKFNYNNETESTGTIGLGVDYYKKIYDLTGYIGSSINFEDAKSMHSTNIEIGILYSLSKNVYLDLGYNCLTESGNNKLSTRTIGLGTAIFF